MEERIKSYRGFLRKWQLVIAIFLLSIIGLVALGKILDPYHWLASLSNILLLPFLIGTWDLLASQPLGKGARDSFTPKLESFRMKQKNRQIIWIVFFVAGISLAVFASLGKWDSIYVSIGLGLTLPAGLFYLAALGLGLQSDWLLHSLNRET